MKAIQFLLLLAVSVSLTLVSCEKKGPAEKAGEKIDQAAEKVGDAVDKAVDKATN